MWNFVSGNKAHRAVDLFPETKFHIRKYDGIENIEKRSPPLEVTLGSSTDTNLGPNHTKSKTKKKCMVEIYFRIAFSLEVVGPWSF